ncbi:spermidine synthase [Promicromonospora sukumoe]|uniref:SAM-dependent methyltransferase n=1 Tax=Promicromonospora sukumoe TaxID=88382 RepID=A0A7W3PCR2_9MICO|nr:fused MFS/spermidine synthase [Promicromonospora sukumoe]MBA8807013.1 SAM-dependent methyltransferase [Promicromonospora sukumoe]
MARRSARRRPSSSAPLTLPAELPVGPVPISTGTAEVVRDPDFPQRVTLHVNGVPSSSLDLADPGFLDFEYMQQMAAFVALLPPGPLRVLHLGAAGSAFARHVEHERPGSRQLGVDLDPRLLELVREWFALPRSPLLRLRADDAGRALASARDASYDVVVRDVFAGDRTPAHLVGTGFAAEAHRVLRPGGILLVNCADRPPLTTARREVASLAEAFGPGAAAQGRLAAVAEPAILKGRRYGNLVLAAVREVPEDGPGDDVGGADPGDARDDDPRATQKGAQDGPQAPGQAGSDVGQPDLRDARLGRALRALAVPATLLAGDDAAAFAGTAAPLETAAPA